MACALIFAILNFFSTDQNVSAQTGVSDQNFVRANTTISTGFEAPDYHQYRISPDGTLVADFCPIGNLPTQLTIYESNSNVLYSTCSVFEIVGFSPDSTQLLFTERERQSINSGQPTFKYTIKVWDKRSQTITALPAEKLALFSAHFLGDREIAYIEDIGDFSFTKFAKVMLASKVSELMPSKLHQHIFIKSIQSQSLTRIVGINLDIPKGWFGKGGSGMLCTSSNGNYFAIRFLSGDISNEYKSGITSLALFDSPGNRISSIMYREGVLFPLWISDDGKSIVTSTSTYEHSKFRTAENIVTVDEKTGDALIDWEWSTGAVRWARHDIKFWNGGRRESDLSVCNGQIAVRATNDQHSQQWIEIINEDNGKTERTFALNYNDVKAIRLTAANTVVMIRRGGQRQTCYIDSEEIK